MEVELDETNWNLLRELQEDGRISFSELGRRVHLSAPAVAERVKRLEEAGIIAGYRAMVDASKVGWNVTAIIRVACHGPRCVLRDPEVGSWPEVLSVDRVTGDACSVLRVHARSVSHLEQLIERLARYGPPSSTMVLSSLVRWQPCLPPGED